jgi:hypothetical protein
MKKHIDIKENIPMLLLVLFYAGMTIALIIITIIDINKYGFIYVFLRFVSEQPRMFRLVISMLLSFLSIPFFILLGKIFRQIENYEDKWKIVVPVIIIFLIPTIIKMPIIVFCIIGIIELCLIFLLLEILIGKLIGRTLSEKSGLVLGIVLIILGVTLFIGIPVIIYSSDKYMNLRKNKFIGKNYIDILTENGLQEYIPLFEKNKLTDINIISELTEDDYQKIGINIMGDRKKILKLFSIE